jgi:hypothetical protein
VNAAAARKRLVEIGGSAPHEARHVAAAMLLGVPVVKATAVPEIRADGELDLGRVDMDPGRREYQDVRKRALVLLAGPMGEEKNWPPPHPSHPSMQGKTPARPDNDGGRLWKAIDALGMGELDYEVLVQEARDLVKRRDFKQLEVGIGWLLEQGHEIGPELCERVREITRKEAQTVPLAVNAGDAGTFKALGDMRAGADRIAKGAFARTIKRWQDSGEQIPLFWLETPSFPCPVGSVDPATLSDDSYFTPLFGASIDLDGEHRTEARHAWEAVKANGVDLRMEYMLLDADEKDGRRTLQELDVTSLTLDPTSEGRKAIATERRSSLRDMRRDFDRLRLELAVGDVDLDAIEAAREPEPHVPTMGELRQQAKALGIPVPAVRKGSAEWFRDDMLRLLTSTDKGEKSVRRRARRPVERASFEC